MNTTCPSGVDSPSLYDWQEDHADALESALRKYSSAMDGSDTGTGKTVVALEVARRLDRIPFVVCPKPVVPSWVEWMKKFRPDDPAYFAFTYEKMRGGNTNFLARSGKKVAWRLKSDKVLIIMDECHRAKSDKSLNSKMLAQAKDARIPVLMLSATACSNPVEMRAIGYHLDFHTYRNWWQWCLKTGCRRGRFGGLDFNNSDRVLKAMHSYIYPERGSRIRIKDLPEGAFPDNLVIPDGYRVDEPDTVDSIYSEMKGELAALAERKADDSDDSALVIQLRARQETELLKVPTFVELARDALQEGNAVVIFVNFRATLNALDERLSASAPFDNGDVYLGTSLIHGDQKDRSEAVASFQSNKNRLCLCMIQAGGVGLSLHDETGDRPRVSLISPSFSAIDLKQTLGRIHRAGGKSPAIQKIVFAAGTVEMRVSQAIRRKLNNLDLINDDELNPIL